MSDTNMCDKVELCRETAHLVCGKNFECLNKIGREHDCYVRFNLKTGKVFISGKSDSSVFAVREAIIERESSMREKCNARPSTLFTPINMDLVPLMMGVKSSRLLSVAKKHGGSFIRFDESIGSFRVTARDEQTLANVTQSLGELQSQVIQERNMMMKKLHQAAKSSSSSSSAHNICVSVPEKANITRVVVFVALYDDNDIDEPVITEQVDYNNTSAPICVNFKRAVPVPVKEAVKEAVKEQEEVVVATPLDDWSELTDQDSKCQLDEAQVLLLD